MAVSDRDIFATANLVIKQHGETAALFAARRADELLSAGDAEGAAIWRQIKGAIETLRGAQRWDFGFTCGVFSVALAADGIVIPASKDEVIKRSTFPYASNAETSGRFTLRVTGDEGTICDLPVEALWITHSTKPWPFLGFRVEDAKTVVETLRQCTGKMVRFAFKRRPG